MTNDQGKRTQGNGRGENLCEVMDPPDYIYETSRTTRILQAIDSGELPNELRDVNGITAERSAIDDYLVTSGYRIYGFNTYLGERDDTDAKGDYQDELLEGHLVGRTYDLDLAALRAITAAKLYQVQAGGSGISVAGYQIVLGAWDRNLPVRIGAWQDYYGAGDVIPGSWWINCMLEGSAPASSVTLTPSAHLRPGDLIAMMSGTFVSTGFAVTALHEFIDFAGNALWALSRHCHPPHPALASSGDIDEVFGDYSIKTRRSVDVQSSVVVRDGAPFTSAAASAVTTLSGAIDIRLGRPSANPWFEVIQEDGVCHGHYSQSSFLDLRVSSALNVAADVVRFLAAAVKSVMEVDHHPTEAQIRLPKAAEVLIEELSVQPSSRFAIHESGGLEDICDRTIARASHLRSMVDTGNRLIGLYTDSRGQEGREEAISAFSNALKVLT